jgi:hypothetical protein
MLPQFHEENTINMHAGYPDYRLRQAQTRDRSDRPVAVLCVYTNSIPDTQGPAEMYISGSDVIVCAI